MGKRIRMSEQEARAAGLVDPDIRDLVGRGVSGSGASGKKAGKGAAKTGRRKTGRRKKRADVGASHPAIHPRASLGPAGSGVLELLVDDAVGAAEFRFDLVPVPKERARVITSPGTGRVFGYTPPRTKYFNDEIRRVVSHVFNGRAPIAGPVSLTLTFVMAIPESWPEWKKVAARAGVIAPTGRPDMDNIEKTVLDAFNGMVIVDDAFVVERRARKIYGDLPAVLARAEKTGQAGLSARREAVETLRRLRDEAGDTPVRDDETRRGS